MKEIIDKVMMAISKFCAVRTERAGNHFLMLLVQSYLDNVDATKLGWRLLEEKA